MCGRFRRTQSYQDYVKGLGQAGLHLVYPPAHAAPNLEPQLDIRPTNPAPVFRMREGGEGLEMTMVKWWFVSHRHKGTFKDRPKLSTFNARAESVASSYTFRDSFFQRRCLVPADGWYEWTGELGSKTKWLFTRKDGEWLCFAGLWDRFQDSEAGPTDTFTIITQPAGAPLSEYHDRAPAVLERRDWARWLDLKGDAQPLIRHESADAFEIVKAA